MVMETATPTAAATNVEFELQQLPSVQDTEGLVGGHCGGCWGCSGCVHFE
jgi:hypothetical protein